MIVATDHTTLKNALQFRPETGELAGNSYAIFFRVCSNPACDCGFTVLDFHANDDSEELVSILEANVHERMLKLREESPTISAHVLETMERGMQDTDWENLERGYYLYKNILAEDFDVENLDVDFPTELFDDPATMQAYIDYLPAAAVFRVNKNNEKYDIIDQYCINPICKCTDVYLSVSGENSSPTGFLYNYRSKKINIEESSLDLPTAEDFINQLRSKNEGFEKQLLKRNQNMRTLFGKFLKKHHRSLIPTLPTIMKTGRNEPCPCGSGKKFKHCCGR